MARSATRTRRPAARQAPPRSGSTRSASARAASARAASKRAAPRPRVPARRSGIRWDRVGRIALLATLGVIMLLYVSPAQHWIEQSRTAGEQSEELRRLTDQNRELKARARELRGPGALERQARRLGMVKQGERSYVIENLPRR